MAYGIPQQSTLKHMCNFQISNHSVSHLASVNVKEAIEVIIYRFYVEC